MVCIFITNYIEVSWGKNLCLVLYIVFQNLLASLAQAKASIKSSLIFSVLLLPILIKTTGMPWLKIYIYVGRNTRILLVHKR